jgi:hypothetical protein
VRRQQGHQAITDPGPEPPDLAGSAAASGVRSTERTSLVPLPGGTAIPADAGIPALNRLDDANVSLFPLKMGEFTVYASLPESTVAAAHAALAPDFSGYYRLYRPGQARFPRRRRAAGVPEDAGPPAHPAGESPDLAWSRMRWRPWPWLAGLDPFPFMAHSYMDETCLVADGRTWSVTDRLLGSWLRPLPGLSIVRRPLENPLVLLTCTENATHQELANQVGRLVWFTKGTTILTAGTQGPAELADWAFLGLHGTRTGEAGRFSSVYPQGPSGDRVRWAYRRRFASSALDWLVERSAAHGSTTPAGLRPHLFGGARLRGLSYFDRRDHLSRAAVLLSRALWSSYVAWTPNDAYQPGTPAETDPATGTVHAAARPWNSQDLGELPFDVKEVTVAVGYFAHGRFAVYDQRRDVTYWQAPLAFGLRLGRDLAAAEADRPARAGTPRRVVLLTDFDAVPAAARADVARGIGGAELITVNAPSTLFEDRRGGLQARIALLPANGGVTVPEWTSTTPAGISATLSPAPALRPDPARRRYRRARYARTHDGRVPVPESRRGH